MTSYRSVLLALFAGWAVQAGPALASEPDVTLTCIADEGAEWGVSIYLADRRMEVKGQSLPITEVRSDAIVATGYKGEATPGASWAYRTYSWTISRNSLTFEMHGVAAWNDRESYIHGQCKKATAQF